MADPQEIDVLHLIGTLSAGGAERNLCYLARLMAKSRFRYGIGCLVGRGDLAAEVEAADIPVWEFGFRKRYTFSTIWRLAGFLKQKKVKILHTHLFVPGVVGRLAGLMAGTPVMITHEHGKTLWKKWHHRLAERLLLPITDLRIAVSQDILRLRHEREHTPLSKMRVVYNAVDPAPFAASESLRAGKRRELEVEDAFVVGAVGRLVEAKSFDLLLDVARGVCARRGDARFVIVGEGPLEGKLRELAGSCGLSDRVIFLGRRSDVPALMGAFDLYLITSKREGLPLSLIEAMMAARPIVATSVGGIPDAISNNAEGLVVDPGDRGALVEAVLTLAGDPDRRSRLGMRARERALKQFAPEKVLEGLEGIYRGLLGGV
jgi:glycosyltransferase involved in cell wall biosynthesis